MNEGMDEWVNWNIHTFSGEVPWDCFFYFPQLFKSLVMETRLLIPLYIISFFQASGARQSKFDFCIYFRTNTRAVSGSNANLVVFKLCPWDPNFPVQNTTKTMVYSVYSRCNGSPKRSSKPSAQLSACFVKGSLSKDTISDPLCFVALW